MLFTFVTDPPAQHPPMRVRVFQARCTAPSSEGASRMVSDLGERAGWYSFDAIPYESMWKVCFALVARVVLTAFWDRGLIAYRH